MSLHFGRFVTPCLDKKVTFVAGNNDKCQMLPPSNKYILRLLFGTAPKECSPVLQATVSIKPLRIAERRSEPRIGGPFPAIALNVGACQKSLGVRAVLDNFCASGCYLRMTHGIEQDESLVLITQISGAVIALRGVVLRVEQRNDGTYGLAVAISQYQIFSLGKFQG